MIGTEIVARSAPDGYNLVLVVAAHVINPSLKTKMPFDVLKDFTAVTLVAGKNYGLNTRQLTREARQRWSFTCSVANFYAHVDERLNDRIDHSASTLIVLG